VRTRVRGSVSPRADGSEASPRVLWRTLTRLPLLRRGGEPGLAVDDGREASAVPDDFAPAARGFNPDPHPPRSDHLRFGWEMRVTYMVVSVKMLGL